MMLKWLVVGLLALNLWCGGARAETNGNCYNIAMSQSGASNPDSNNPTRGVIFLDRSPQNWGQGVSVLVNFSSGSGVGTVTAQVSDNAATGIPSSQWSWNNHEAITAVTGDTNSNIFIPVNAVRLYVTGYVSGTITLSVCQLHG